MKEYFMISEAKFVLKRKNIVNEVSKSLLHQLKVCENSTSKYYSGKLGSLYVIVYSNSLTITGDFSQYINDDITEANMSIYKFQRTIQQLENELGICLDEMKLEKGITFSLNLDMHHPSISYVNRIESCKGAIKNSRSYYGTTFCFGKSNNIYRTNTISIRGVTIGEKELLNLKFSYIGRRRYDSILKQNYTLGDFKNEETWKFFYNKMNSQLDLFEWKKIRKGENLQSKTDITDFILENINLSPKQIKYLEQTIEEGRRNGTTGKTSYFEMKQMLSSFKSNLLLSSYDYSHRSEFHEAVYSLQHNLLQPPTDNNLKYSGSH